MDQVAGKENTPQGVSVIKVQANELNQTEVDGNAGVNIQSLGPCKRENGMVVEKTQEAEISTKNVDLTVFVGKLSERVTSEELKQFFTKETKSEENEVLGVTMPWKVVKKSKRLGIAFVDFSNNRAYQVALTLNNVTLHGQNILVLPATKTHEGLLLMDGPEGEAKEGETNVKTKNSYVPVYKKSDHVAYIKNLPHGVTEDDVLAFFKFTRDDIVDIAIPIPFKAKRNAKRPVRAIIAFPTEESLQKCLDMTKTTFRDREVVVERHQMVSKIIVGEKRSASEEGNEANASPEKHPRTAGGDPIGGMELDLFVKHIPRDASDRQIKEFFGSVGATVLKVNLFSESVTGSTRGMGFVSMADKASVQKGMTLDCTRFYKNKVRISVRRDREHLDRPDTGETLPNFSVFIGNLPVKEKVDILKNEIFKHFEVAGCTIKYFHMPLEANKPDHKGYAYIVFDSEDSLKKAQDLNNSDLKLPSGKVTIQVTERWPENPPEAAGGDQAKESSAQRAASNVQQSEPPGSGKQKKRKKGLPPTGVPQGIHGPRGPRGPMGPMGPMGAMGAMGPMGPGDNMGPQNRWNCPPGFQPDGPDYGPYGPEYQDYLDYLDYRDYVAMRKAYDERRELAEFRSRYRSEREEPFVPQPQDQPNQQLPQTSMQSPIPPPPPPPPLNQGPIGSGGYSRPLGGVPKEGHLDDGYRSSSLFSSCARRDHVDYDDAASGTANLSSSRSRDYRDFDYGGSRSGPANSGYSATGQGSGNYGSSGTGSAGVVNTSGPYMGSDQRGSANFNISDSFSSLNSSRYQTAADSTFSRSHLDTSGASSNAMGFSRESSATYRHSPNGLDLSTRGGGLSSFSSGYPSGVGNGRGSLSSTSGTSVMSNVRTSVPSTARPFFPQMTFSLGRSGTTFLTGISDSSGYVGSVGGSYTGGDLAQRFSFSSGSALPQDGDRLRYSGFGLSSSDGIDQYRKGSQYDKSDAGVSRLGTSGVASNAGYDGYSGLSGYRVG